MFDSNDATHTNMGSLVAYKAIWNGVITFI